jgi:hypothetical protein
MRNDPGVKQRMFDHISRWQQSALSQKQYCTENKIAYYVFHYWYKRYRDEQGINQQSSSFIRMHVQSCASSGPVVELVFVNGTRLVFHQPVSSDYLKSIIS